MPNRIFMKRIILMAIAALFCVAGYAQEYIDIDKTENGTRFIRSKACPIITNDLDVVAMSFICSKDKDNEIYSMALVFYNSLPFSITQENGMRIKSIEGESIYLYPLADSWSKPHNGEYLISVMYEIPKEKIRSLICAMKDITILFKQNGSTKSKTFYIPFSSAEDIMETYLHFAIYTGN